MVIPSIINIKPGAKIQAVKPGDVVKVSQKFKEGDKEKFQSFQGVVIRVKSGKNNSSFTVRRVSHGVGVERVFFNASPNLEKVEVLKQAKVRRSRLYYLRKLSGSASRLKERRRERVIAEEIAPAEAPEEAEMAAQAIVAEQTAQPLEGAVPQKSAEIPKTAPAAEAKAARSEKPAPAIAVKAAVTEEAQKPAKAAEAKAAPEKPSPAIEGKAAVTEEAEKPAKAAEAKAASEKPAPAIEAKATVAEEAEKPARAKPSAEEKAKPAA